MLNFTLPTIKSVGSLDTVNNTVPVVYTLVDNTGAAFDYDRDVTAALDVNGNVDGMTTSRRCYEILTGLIANCALGHLSKAKQDEYNDTVRKNEEVAAKLQADHEAAAANQQTNADATTATAAPADAATTTTTAKKA